MNANKVNQRSPPRLRMKRRFEHIEKRRVGGLLTIDYQTTMHTRQVRRYHNNPARVEQTATTTVSV